MGIASMFSKAGLSGWKGWVAGVSALSAVTLGAYWSFTQKGEPHNNQARGTAATDSKKAEAKKIDAVDSKSTAPADRGESQKKSKHAGVKDSNDLKGVKGAYQKKETLAEAEVESDEDTDSVEGVALCGQELAGDGPSMQPLSAKDWSKIMDQFHKIKDRYRAWITKHGKALPADLVVTLKEQVDSIRLSRPPTVDEPDLAWRGMSVWGLTEQGLPTVSMGGGVPQSFAQNPKAAQFELARTIAMAWTPCELKRLGKGHPWGPYLQCMGLNAAEKCEPGSFSQAGWAVATLVASRIAEPGCAVPGLTDPQWQACIAKVPPALGTLGGRKGASE